MRTLDIANDYELTLHRLEEIKINSIKIEHLEEEDRIQSSLQLTKSSRISTISSHESQDSQDSNSTNRDINEDLTRSNSEEDNQEDEFLVKMSYNLAERDKNIGESTLLQDLKILKDEAWAIKKARKLRRLKKVQFKDLQPVQFQRKCCSCGKNGKNGKNANYSKSYQPQEALLMQDDGKRTNSRNLSPTVSNSPITMKALSHTDNKNNARPVATVHSIDMFGSIIPSYMFPVSSHSSTFFTTYSNSSRSRPKRKIISL